MPSHGNLVQIFHNQAYIIPACDHWECTGRTSNIEHRVGSDPVFSRKELRRESFPGKNKRQRKKQPFREYIGASSAYQAG